MDHRSTTTRYRRQLTALGAAMLCLAAANASYGQDQDVLDAEGITVFGQRELPKVLYIVPWKKMGASEIDMPITESLVADVLNPIDPDVFRREIQYHELMHNSPAPKSR